MAPSRLKIKIVRGEDREVKYPPATQITFRAFAIDGDDVSDAGVMYVNVSEGGTGPFKRPTIARVKWVEVEEEFRKQHIGTKLYEAAAKHACTRLKVPLRSDDLRSAYSQGFWDKQMRKGRADCLESCEANDGCRRSNYVVGRGGCLVYTLRCPAPRSLAGATSRTRGRRR